MPRHLILVPTEMERRILAPILAPVMAQGCRVALCGFGPVAAAARTAQLLAQHAPERVLLVGIAGRLDDRLAVGAAYAFERVACYGVGAGSGGEFVPAGAMGWQQWPGDADGTSLHGDDPIGDEIGGLTSYAAGDDDGSGRAGLLLTVCAAAASDEDVRLRRQTFPAAVAEEMEGFAVAFACRLRGVPARSTRGTSVTAAGRATSLRLVSAAVEAAGSLALQVLAEAS